MTTGGAGMAQVAVVTGGGSGLGREMALALAAAGYRVWVTGRTEEKLQETAAAAANAAAAAGSGGSAGGGGWGVVEAVVLDVADGEAVRGFFGGLERVDVLVNN